MNARFDGRVVLITGGAGALAGATAQAFAERGATVVLAARDPDHAAEAAARIRPGGGKVDWIAADVIAGRVSDPAEVAATVLWLASDESSFVVGHDLVVDDGATA
ncbi:hypothetical protein DN069_34200 [Streptacidiphilus pinicola]|uniref:Short-chain dehydrogenase n=1 Tax=Streptacidiphilus pinicola TaxID=2219663 RepID=A0A2X0I9N5_9ACTN|nr:SDR family oxidoreductase [Streptacidiphilus pinicola]RAG81207.1 hypothetical protein DN069_34200 [Streptacidiphilus pinicola]